MNKQTEKSTVFHSTAYDEYHQIRKENSESWDKIILHVRKCLPNNLNSQRYCFLSVGCGDGETDMKIMDDINYDIFYHGVDVDSKPIERFHKELKNQKKIEFQLSNCCFDEKFVENQKKNGNLYDLILFVHCIHLFPDPLEAITIALDLLSKNGFVLIAIHVYSPGVPKLIDELYDGVSFESKKFLTAETLLEKLKNFNVKYETLESKVDVTDVINKSESGIKMFSFMLSMRNPTENDIEKLRTFSEFNRDTQRWFLREPVMILKIMK